MNVRRANFYTFPWDVPWIKCKKIPRITAQTHIIYHQKHKHNQFYSCQRKTYDIWFMRMRIITKQKDPSELCQHWKSIEKDVDYPLDSKIKQKKDLFIKSCNETQKMNRRKTVFDEFFIRNFSWPIQLKSVARNKTNEIYSIKNLQKPSNINPKKVAFYAIMQLHDVIYINFWLSIANEINY